MFPHSDIVTVHFIQWRNNRDQKTNRRTKEAVKDLHNHGAIFNICCPCRVPLLYSFYEIAGWVCVTNRRKGGEEWMDDDDEYMPPKFQKEE